MTYQPLQSEDATLKTAMDSDRELTFEEFCEQPMQYRMGMSGDRGARRLYRNDALGLQKEVITPRNPKAMSWGNGKAYYFMDNDPREFANVAELYVAWMHRVCNEPEAAASLSDQVGRTQ